MQHHSFFKNLSSLSKITRATSLKIGASYAKNWAGDLLVRIYPQLRINKSDIPNTVSYYYKKLLNIDNSKCIIRHYTKKKTFTATQPDPIWNLKEPNYVNNTTVWILTTTRAELPLTTSKCCHTEARKMFFKKWPKGKNLAGNLVCNN